MFSFIDGCRKAELTRQVWYCSVRQNNLLVAELQSVRSQLEQEKEQTHHQVKATLAAKAEQQQQELRIAELTQGVNSLSFEKGELDEKVRTLMLLTNRQQKMLEERDQRLQVQELQHSQVPSS